VIDVKRLNVLIDKIHSIIPPRLQMPLADTRRNQELRKSLRALAPLISYADSELVLERAAKIARGDVSPGAALWLAIVAHVRHRHTEYDALLAEGYDRDAARHFVVERTEEVLRAWGCSRRIDVDAED
jgi:hypothetical protein